MLLLRTFFFFLHFLLSAIYVHNNLFYIIKRKTTSAQLRAITLTTLWFCVWYRTELWYSLRLLRFTKSYVYHSLFTAHVHTMFSGFCIGLCLHCFWRETRGVVVQHKENGSDRAREAERGREKQKMWERARHHYMSWCFSFPMMVQKSIAIRHWCEFLVAELGKQQQKWRAKKKKNNRQCYGSRTVHAKVCCRRHTWFIQMNGDGYSIRNSNGIFSFNSSKSLKFCTKWIERAIRNPIYLRCDNATNDDVCYSCIVSNSAETFFMYIIAGINQRQI